VQRLFANAGFTDDLYAFGKSYKGYVNKATRELVARMDEVRADWLLRRCGVDGGEAAGLDQ
jgi:hypothetical protein